VVGARIRRACAVAAGLALAVLGGCGGGDEAARPVASATPAPTAAPAQTPAPPPAPKAQRVRFPASDGKRVAASYTPAGRKAPGVVLLHQIDGGPGQWEPLVPYLHAAGFATLAYQSRPSALENERLPDAIGALRWLRARPDVDPRRLALVGASIGASTAVLAMATEARRTVDAAVALSAVDSSDLWALQDAGRYRPHDVLFVSDARESSASEGLMEGAVRSKQLQSAEAGHGVALLPEEGVRDALLAWLRDRVR
jgi:dipeptidyl aminopeptidase/acylaminoacyl peptidase